MLSCVSMAKKSYFMLISSSKLEKQLQIISLMLEWMIFIVQAIIVMVFLFQSLSIHFVYLTYLRAKWSILSYHFENWNVNFRALKSKCILNELKGTEGNALIIINNNITKQLKTKPKSNNLNNLLNGAIHLKWLRSLFRVPEIAFENTFEI